MTKTKKQWMYFACSSVNSLTLYAVAHYWGWKHAIVFLFISAVSFIAGLARG